MNIKIPEKSMMLLWDETSWGVQQGIDSVVRRYGQERVCYTDPVQAADGTWVSIVRLHTLSS